jgi:hypothetical protein
VMMLRKAVVKKSQVNWGDGVGKSGSWLGA